MNALLFSYVYRRLSRFNKIVKKDEAGSGSSNRLTALKKMSKSDKEDLAVDLESQLYDLFSFEETKKVNPKKAVKKGQANQLQSDVLSRMEMVAEAQGQIDQAWNAGVITKAKRQELMSKFIQPMTEYLENTWNTIMQDKNHHIIVKEIDDKIVSSCVCVIIPNLTRNIRPYAFVENVVTHLDYRGKGYATECLNFAKEIAEKENCYKMMLLTGSKNEKTLNFYRNAGYNSTDKTAFIQWIE